MGGPLQDCEFTLGRWTAERLGVTGHSGDIAYSSPSGPRGSGHGRPAQPMQAVKMRVRETGGEDRQGFYFDPGQATPACQWPGSPRWPQRATCRRGWKGQTILNMWPCGKALRQEHISHVPCSVAGILSHPPPLPCTPSALACPLSPPTSGPVTALRTLYLHSGHCSPLCQALPSPATSGSLSPDGSRERWAEKGAPAWVHEMGSGHLDRDSQAPVTWNRDLEQGAGAQQSSHSGEGYAGERSG